MTKQKGAEDPAAKVNALVELAAGAETNHPKAGAVRSASFEGSAVRGRFHKNEWWLSIVDVLTGLQVSTQPARYWNELKAKLIDLEGFSELFGRIEKLKMPSADGKLRGTEAVNIKTLLRIFQSVPSPKVEPLKQWLAQVGFERIVRSAPVTDKRSATLLTRSCPQLLQQDLCAMGRSTPPQSRTCVTVPCLKSSRKALAVLLTTFRNCRTTADGSPGAT